MTVIRALLARLLRRPAPAPAPVRPGVSMDDLIRAFGGEGL